MYGDGTVGTSWTVSSSGSSRVSHTKNVMDVDDDDRPVVTFGSAAATRVGVASSYFTFFPRFSVNFFPLISYVFFKLLGLIALA
jgi:hypothetical protein